MRTALAASILSALAMALCSCSHLTPPLVVSGNPSAPPMNWVEDGSLMGVGPDCAKIAFSSIGEKPQIVNAGNWKEAIDKARSGEVDVLVALFKNEERMAFLDFSIPYMDVPVVVCVRRGAEFPFSRWEDLIGRKGVIGTGESYGQDFDQFAAAKLQIARASLGGCLKSIVDGSADYMVVNKYAGSIEAFRAGCYDQISFLEVPICTQSYHMAISKKSPYLKDLESLNLKLRAMRVEGTPERLAAKYLIMWRNRTIERRDTGASN